MAPLMQDDPNGGKKIILKWLTRDPHGESGRIPEIMRLVMVFIDRIGFPILAFLINSAFMAFILYKVTPVLYAIKNLLERNS